jgi:lysophospholipase L1-like esterase
MTIRFKSFLILLTGMLTCQLLLSSAVVAADNTLVVRARGTAGSESITLSVGDTNVQTWMLSTSMQDYTATTGSGGEIEVAFINDASDRDVQIDYIQVNGETRQAENQSYNTGVYVNGACGGSNSEWLHCNGAIRFGTVSSSGDLPLVVAINAGSSSTVTYQGVQYQGDRYSSGGRTNSTSDPIAGTDEDALFQTERYGTYAYQVPVTEAMYSINLHFVELYWEGVGERSFSITVEGTPVLSNIDLYSQVGHDTAFSTSVNDIFVSDGKLTIQLDTQVDNATLSGFAIYSEYGELVEPGGDGEFCPDDALCRILPLGNSITDGIGMPGGYRVELFSLSLESGFDIDYVGSLSNGPATVDGVPFPSAHEGHSGWTIQQINNIVNQGVVEIGADIILLHIGTNDMFSNASSAPGNLATLLDNIISRVPDSLLVVSNIIPLPSASSAVNQYNAQIPAIVESRAAQGANILFVDQFTGFPTSELGDGVHPNQAGYARMAGKWFEAIDEYLKDIDG